MDPGNPLTMLVRLVGIALILLAVWLTGGARHARLDRALVLRRLGEDAPDFAAEGQPPLRSERRLTLAMFSLKRSQKGACAT